MRKQTDLGNAAGIGRRLFLLVFGVAAVAALYLYAPRLTEGQLNYLPAGLTVIADPALPMTVGVYGAAPNYVKHLSTLEYRVSNASRKHLKQFVLAAKEVDASGKVLGGEQITVPADIPAGGTRSFSTEIAHFIPVPSNGERVTLAVLRADFDGRTWTVAPADFNRAAAEVVRGQTASVTAQESGPGPLEKIDCTDFSNLCHADAGSDCAPAGIQSYACGAGGGGCDCSYTCK